MKLRVKPSEFAVKVGESTGRFAPDVVKFLKFARNLREAETEPGYVPSTRETISFIRNLAEGKTFNDYEKYLADL